jgi:hypothetical protein
MTFRFGLPMRVGVFSPSWLESEVLEELPVPGLDFVLLGASGEVRGPSESGVDGTDLSDLRIPNQPVRESGRGARYSGAI